MRSRASSIGRLPSDAGSSSESEKGALLADILDELSDRLAAGDSGIDLASYIARVPEQAEILKETYASLREISRMRTTLLDDTTDSSLLGATPLGDFRLIREIGRGGMGVVYEAEQLSLGRRMAVKVLPFAGLLAPRQLQRFQNEARAAAILKHNNIVRVHSIGHERGIHYYAMDLVDGCTIAELIRRLREFRGMPPSDKTTGTTGSGHEEGACEQGSPGAVNNCWDETSPFAAWTTNYTQSPLRYSQAVACLGATLADALDYAHEQGVTHRDIKPSNLILASDGNPWITDFGLAHIHGTDNLTMTGDRVGTLRYMSPEQAQGRHVLDHRTDIYSLGVTLYELLTLHPAHSSRDGGQLLREIDERHPRRIRAVDARVPRDLDTVVMKAMAKVADDRYETASALADDLRRFVEHRPISARRTTWGVRIRRWIARHRLATALATTLLLLLLVMSIAGPLVAWRYSRLAQSEVAARAAVEKTRDELQSMLRDTIGTTAEALENTPHIDDLHEEFLRDTVNHYQRILRIDPDDDKLRLEVAKGYLRMGTVANLRFSRKLGRELTNDCISLLEQVSARLTDDQELLSTLANAYWLVGSNQWRSDPFRTSVGMLEELVRIDPANLSYRRDLGWAQQYLGATLCHECQWEEAERWIEKSKKSFSELMAEKSEVLDYVDGYAHALFFSARTHTAMELLAQAREEANQSIAMLQPQADKNKPIRWEVAYWEHVVELGRICYWQGDYATSERELRRAIDALAKMSQGFPSSDWTNGTLNRAKSYLGDCLVAVSRHEEAEQAYCESITGWTTGQATTENIRDHAEVNDRLGQLLWRSGNTNSARRHFEKAIELSADIDDHRKMAAIYADCLDNSLRSPPKALLHARQIPSTNVTKSRHVGLALLRAGDYEHAIDALRTLIDARTVCCAYDYFLLTLCYHHMHDAATASKWYDRGMACMNSPATIDRLMIEDLRKECEFFSQQR